MSTEYRDMSTEYRDFGVTDGKGRKVGAMVFKSTLEVETEEQASRWQVVPGTYYTFLPSATRDGFNYGASQSLRLFDSETKLHFAVEAYFRDARNRARRNRKFVTAMKSLVEKD